MDNRNKMRNSANETLKMLKECNAIIENDHFVYVSGHHGSSWINKDAILPNVKRVKRLGKLLAERLKYADAEVVCAPAIAGIIIAQWTAYYLNTLAVFAEHDPSWKPGKGIPGSGGLGAPFILRRGYDKLVAGRNVVVVDDIINTGFSAKSTVEAISKVGGEVEAVAVIVNRGNIVPEELGVNKLIYSLEYKLPVWEANECKLCLEGFPINKEYGHGHEYVISKSYVRR